jgi:hypothetical protein
VIGLGSHRLLSFLIGAGLRDHLMSLLLGVCPISDSIRVIFVLAILRLRVAALWNEIALCGLPVELEMNYAALLFPS